MRAIRLSAFALLLAAMPVCASAATLTITVENISKKGGILHVALYDEATWPNDEATPIADAAVPVMLPWTVVTLKDLRPGIYGLKSYQDANRNGKFDQNWIGMPLEPYGFSRDARPFLSEPGFDRTKFTLSDGANEIVIHLQ
jgi:uncharacterized protein (DUF2141 family)